MKIASFGEILWDVYPDKAVLGGAPLNFAAHAARHGASVTMVSAVGSDELGDAALEKLKEWGVDVSGVARSTYPTGTCVVTLSEGGIPSYRLCENVAWDDIACDLSAVAGCNVLYFGSLSLREEHNRRSLEQLLSSGAFDEVLVDINIRPPFYTAATLEFALEQATVVKISDEEWPIVRKTLGLQDSDEVFDSLKQRYPRLKWIVFTKGEHGAEAFDCNNGRLWKGEAVSATLCSTVGAGDSFCASFFTRLMATGDPQAALDHAAKVAALVVSYPEAVPEYDPSRL